MGRSIDPSCSPQEAHITRELTLICQECSRPISDDVGYLWAHTAKMNAVQRTERAWQERHADADGSLSFDLAGLLENPDLEKVSWQAHHRDRDPAREASHYRIAADKLRTRADLLEWTAHPMEKAWLRSTDWRDVLREARSGGKRLAATAL
ncbi:hypothetical protein [Streptomyces violaceusniger]|nr:hypothetical protein [Streptomyces violaceusniger]